MGADRVPGAAGYDGGSQHMIDRVYGTRVMLINTPIREAAAPNCAPLGVALLAGVLRSAGASVSILDLNAYRVKDALADSRGLSENGRFLTTEEANALIARHMIRHGEPHMIGLSGTITTLRWQRHVAQAAREYAPNALLVSGGGLATEFRRGLFQWIPQLDAVCAGDGDEMILQIAADARTIDEHGRVGSVLSGKLGPRLVEHERDGTLRMEYVGEPTKDLDGLPLPAWDLMHADVRGQRTLETYIRNPIWGAVARNSSATPIRMERSLNTVGSRGCPHRCRFCYENAQGGVYRTRSARSIANEMRWMRDKYALDFIGMLDENFLTQSRRLAELPLEMERAGILGKIAWGTHGRLDEAADIHPTSGPVRTGARRVDDLAKAGCAYIGFGAESASPRVLDSMGKGGFSLANGLVELDGFQVPRSMVEGHKNTVEAGIHVNCTWILSYPNSKIEDEKASVAFINWQERTLGNRDGVNRRMFQATAFPGTEMFRHERVRRRLSDGFGISFGPDGREIQDDALLKYVLALDDASKVLTDNAGRPVFYGDTTEDEFLRMRELVEAGKSSEILNL